MILRNLCKKDAPLMLEWLKDPNVNQFFRFDSSSMTLSDAEDFIAHAEDDSTTKHFAVADDNDEYMGTISLKNINDTDKNAELAISFRSKSHGTGISTCGIMAVIDKAFNEMGLEKIYLNVLANNERAINFYKKVGFVYEGEFKKHVCISGKFYDWKWFAVFKNN